MGTFVLGWNGLGGWVVGLRRGWCVDEGPDSHVCSCPRLATPRPACTVCSGSTWVGMNVRADTTSCVADECMQLAAEMPCAASLMKHSSSSKHPLPDRAAITAC